MNPELSKDTAPEIAEMIRKRLMAYSGTERMMMGSRMFDAVRDMVLASLPSGLAEIDLKASLCQRLYGQEVDQAGFIKHLQKYFR